MTKPRTDAWAGNVGNEKRARKMRTVTLSDEAWAELGRRAGGPTESKSAYLECWLHGENAQKTAIPKKRGRKA